MCYCGSDYAIYVVCLFSSNELFWGEKENNEVDGKVKNDDGDRNTMKRSISEENESEPPIKRDKIERESAV